MNKKALLLLPIGLIALLLLKKNFWERKEVQQKGLQFKPIFDASEKKYLIPDNLLAKIGWRESRFNPDIISGKIKSSKGAMGIMQILPSAHPNIAYTDPSKAIPYAGYYLQNLYKNFGSWKLAVMAYNWGPTNVKNWLQTGGYIPTETQNYINEIFG